MERQKSIELFVKDSILNNLAANQGDLASLLQFYEHEIAKNSLKDKLAVLIHFIMIKNHFRFGQNYEINQSRDEKFYNKLMYNQFSIENTIDQTKNLSLEFLDGKFLTINLLKTSETTLDIQFKWSKFTTQFLKVAGFVDSWFENEKKLKEFELNFRQKCLVPFKIHLKNEICSGANWIHVNRVENLASFHVNLIDLPNELLVFKLIASYLNIKSIVSFDLSCKFVHNLLNNDTKSPDSVWKLLLERDFKNRIGKLAQQSDIDYKKKYIEFFKCKKYSYETVKIFRRNSPNEFL